MIMSDMFILCEYFGLSDNNMRLCGFRRLSLNICYIAEENAIQPMILNFAEIKTSNFKL